MLLFCRSQCASFLMLALFTLAIGACDDTSATTAPTPLPTNVNPPVATLTPITPTVSQTLDGITIGVQPLHADAHRITLAIRVDGLAKPHAYQFWRYPPWPTTTKDLLILSVGSTVLPWIESTGGALDGAAHAGEELHDQSTLAFDASGLQITSATLPLRLSIPLYIDNNPIFPVYPLEPLPLPTSAVPVTDTPTPVPATDTPTPAPLPTLPPSSLQFTFSMTMPFDSRRTITDVGQTVESSDVAVTLERIDITSSEAQVWLRYSPTKPDTFLKVTDWAMSGSLSIGSRGDNGVANGPASLQENPDDEEYPSVPGRCNSNISSNPCFLSYLDPPFLGTNPRDATFILTADSLSPNQGPWPAAPSLGTWTFRFNIPVAPPGR